MSGLNAFYNNYLSSYTPKSITRYDTHKKSELRNVYNSIVKLNKESPWYLPTTSKDTQHYAVDIKENARFLHNTLAQFGGLEEADLFQKKSAFSSDSGVVTANFVGEQIPAGMDAEFSIEVQSLATTQENMGKFLEDAPVNMYPSTYSFDVAINDMNYEFQFSIGENETNKDVQERLTRLINSSGIGIKASMVEEEGKTSLKLESENAGLSRGKEQVFKISDEHTSKSKGTVEYFGLDYVSREAADAHFLINGEPKSTSDNKFTVGKMFELELHGVSEEGVASKVGLKTDIESLTDNINHLIGGYNEFLKAASGYLETQAKSKQLVGEMKGIASLYNQSMTSVGVMMEEDGSLNIDENVLRQAAINSDDLSETFGYLKDFSASLLRKSTQVSLNPMDYVEKTVVAYKNPGHNFVSPYSTSAYSGMMFNNYC